MYTNSNSSAKSVFSVKEMTVTAVMTAILCILGPWALTIPISPVPISLCSMGIYFVLSVLGLKLGFVSTALYILLGAFGVPVFSKFTGGIGVLAGPTGGYIIGYLFLALICGFFIEHFAGKILLQFIGFLIGTAVLYLLGTVWLALQLHLSFGAALMAGVVPYIPGDLVKLILAMAAAYPIRSRLIRAGLIPTHVRA